MQSQTTFQIGVAVFLILAHAITAGEGKGKPGGGSSCELSLSVEVAGTTFMIGDGSPYVDGEENVTAITRGERGNASGGLLYFDLEPPRKQIPATRTIWLDLSDFNNFDSPFTGGGASGEALISMRIRALDFCQMPVGSSADTGFWIGIPDVNHSKSRLIVDYGLYIEGARCGQMVSVTRNSPNEWILVGGDACLRDDGIIGPLLDGGDCTSGTCLGLPAPITLTLTALP